MRLDGVWLRYGRQAPWVLRDVSVESRAGELAVVVGRNGAGKSTLLQLAVGVLQPSRGSVAERPSVVGWVPERFPVDQPFTARSYLEFMGAVRGLTAECAAAAVAEWAERLALTPYLDERLPALSKGTAQKVGLVQALMAPPDLLVLDEPWEGLDARTREEVPAIVSEVLARGGSVLVSDHRGETGRLPRAAEWLVSDGMVTDRGPAAGAARAPDPTADPAPADPAPADPEWVVEVGVRATDPAAAAARLRADGHRVLTVRSGPPA